MIIFEKFTGNKIEWNTFCENHGNNDFRQTYEWGEYLNSTGWNVERYKFVENEKTKFCIQYVYKKFWPVYIIYLPSGIIGDNKYIKNFLLEIKKRYKNYFIYFRVDSRKELKIDNLEKLLKLGLKKQFILFAPENI